MHSKDYPYVSLLGRLLLSTIFLLSGFSKVLDWQGTEAYMAQMGMPAIPFFLTAAIVIEIGAGAALLFGFWTRTAAFLLLLFLIPTTLIFHAFWTYEGQEFQAQMIHFLKNLAIMGGLLKFTAVGASILSLDAYLSQVFAGNRFQSNVQRPA